MNDTDGQKLQALIVQHRRELARARWWRVAMFRLVIIAGAIGGVIL